MAKRTQRVVAALGIALAFGSVITGALAATHDDPATPQVEQVKAAVTTDPADPVGMCRITKACAQ